MQIDRTSWVSPNHESRDGQPISLIVLHATVGTARSSLEHLIDPAPWGDPKKAASTHYLIDKAGKIYQLVAEDRAAWHAGVSAFRGLDQVAIKRRSIGIELENKNDGRDPYPPAQVQACIWLVLDLVKRHRIPREMITTHAEIAPSRKSDPRGFSVNFLVEAVYEPDYAALWGDRAPYVAHWGIPTAWRAAYNAGAHWGQALTPEFTGPDGVTYQRFESALVTWTPAGGVFIYRRS